MVEKSSGPFCGNGLVDKGVHRFGDTYSLLAADPLDNRCAVAIKSDSSPHSVRLHGFQHRYTMIQPHNRRRPRLHSTLLGYVLFEAERDGNGDGRAVSRG